MAKVTTVELATRLTLFEDEVKVLNQSFSMNAVTYTEHSADRLVLATSSGWQEINKGGVGTGVYLTVKTDRPIQVSLDATTNPWNVGKSPDGGIVALAGSYTHVYVKNNSTTNQATINSVMTDENA